MLNPLERHAVAQAAALIVLGTVIAGCAVSVGAGAPKIAALGTPVLPPTSDQSRSGVDPVVLAWQAGDGPDDLRCPTGLAVDSRGTLAVVDAGNNRLVHLSRTGQLLGSVGQVGDRPGGFHFSLPSDADQTETCLVSGSVAADADGSLLVTDLVRVRRLDPAGRIIASWVDAGPDDGRLARPVAVAVDQQSGHVYVADDGDARIQAYTRDGQWLRAWGGRGTLPGALANPAALAIDGQGRVYVADRGDQRIKLFDADGRFLLAWGGRGVAAGEFLWPRGVAVDRAGLVYVVDVQRVHVFSSTGVLLAAWPVGDGVVTDPSGIAVDDQGAVYITDMDRGLVRQYLPRGAWPQVAGLPTPRPTATLMPGPPTTPSPLASMTPTDR